MINVETQTASATAPRQVVLEVPQGLAAQLVFRGVFHAPFVSAPPTGLTFRLFRTPARYLGMFRRLRPVFGPLAISKAALKLATARRMAYVVTDGDEIVHHAWLMLGRCRHYRVESQAVVIGPIWTAAAARGRGAATFGARMAINEMIDEGRHVFYIDTSHDNASCLRVIANCGFGRPVATYVRADSLLG